MASSQAEEYGGSVVGWYHSHPHKIVEPSSVDLRTQLQYQMMDSGFVGIIMSVFNTDSLTCNNPVQVFGVGVAVVVVRVDVIAHPLTYPAIDRC